MGPKRLKVTYSATKLTIRGIPFFLLLGLTLKP